MWDPPGPGLEPVCPALAGGFLTTVPPEKPHIFKTMHMYYFDKNKIKFLVGREREGALVLSLLFYF